MTAEHTFNAVQRLARRENRGVQELLTLYVLERFLARLAKSHYADSFVLKGGVLLAGYGLRRPTRDIDLQAIDFKLDENHCAKVVAAVAAFNVDDEMVFDSVATRVEQIRDEEEYSGLRVHVRAQLHRASVAVKLDISSGDPISPRAQPVTMPCILGGEFEMMGHPLETVIAEKAVTILQRGVTSTRWRDYLDLRSLANSNGFIAGALRTAIEEVAKHRKVELVAPSAVLIGHGELAQQKWAAWRTKTDVEDFTREQLGDQLSDVCTFLDLIFLGTVEASATWDPKSRMWS